MSKGWRKFNFEVYCLFNCNSKRMKWVTLAMHWNYSAYGVRSEVFWVSSVFAVKWEVLQPSVCNRKRNGYDICFLYALLLSCLSSAETYATKLDILIFPIMHAHCIISCSVCLKPSIRALLCSLLFQNSREGNINQGAVQCPSPCHFFRTLIFNRPCFHTAGYYYETRISLSPPVDGF